MLGLPENGTHDEMQSSLCEHRLTPKPDAVGVGFCVLGAAIALDKGVPAAAVEPTRLRLLPTHPLQHE